VIYSSDKSEKKYRAETFDEVSAMQSGIFVERGFELIETFLIRNPGSHE
jgi:hypothetical protein